LDPKGVGGCYRTMIPMSAPDAPTPILVGMHTELMRAEYRPEMKYTVRNIFRPHFNS
jgi:hypothetical protein